VIDLAPRFLKSILALYLVPKHGPLGVFLAKLGPLFEERRRIMEKLGGDWPDKPVGLSAAFSQPQCRLPKLPDKY
jgi:hypothetical protein